MSVILKTPITGKVAWKGKDLLTHDDWILTLDDSSLAGLDEALAYLQSTGKAAPDFAREDFPLSARLQADVARIVDELEEGYGFILVKGLSPQRYSEQQMTDIYFGIGLHMGLPVSQNGKGELLGKVTSVGNVNDKKTRVYETNAYLPYHTDLSDVVGLLSIKRARSGGLSSLVSAATVYNEILNHYPEFIGLLYRPVYFDHLGDELPTLSPIFSYHNQKLSCRYLRQYIELGHDIRQMPLSKVEIEALDLIDTIIHKEEIRLDMMMEPGDIQFANNYSVMHSRNSFEDYDDPAEKRKLLRLWLKMPNARELAPEFPGRNGIQPAK